MKLSSNKIFIYPVFVIAFILLPQLISTFTIKEFFPFGPYKMYSYGFRSENLEMHRLFCVFPDHHEEIITNLRLRKVESWYIEKLESSDPTQFQLILEPLWKEVQDTCINVKLYYMKWNHFEGRKRDQPDIKKLVFQYVL